MKSTLKFKEMSIIGKKYKARDNSYSVNLTEPIARNGNSSYVNKSRLAGTYNTPPVKCTILTEPFNALVGEKQFGRKYMPCILVTVDETAETEMVLFFKEGVCDRYEVSDFVFIPKPFWP